MNNIFIKIESLNGHYSELGQVHRMISKYLDPGTF